MVMSLIPSKRVDRIFPVIPPLCLLAAGQIGNRSVSEVGRARVLRWSAVAFLLSVLCAGGYSVFKVFTGYRDNRDALVKFGQAVRREAAAHRWRYEIARSSNEGMLIYCDRLHFMKPESAVTEWNRGNLDALITLAETAPVLMRELHDAALSQFRSARRDNQTGEYVVITR